MTHPTNTFSVKNFDSFQHYKNRAPPWIKLYNELLDDYEFGLLPDASKMHLVAIWLLASRSENKIPYDAGWVAKRINATEPVNLAMLAEKGFILLDQPLPTAEQVASEMLAECLSREREEGEREESREDSRTVAKTRPRASDAFEKFKAAFPRREGSNPWQPAEKKFNALVKTGVDPETMIAAAAALAREEGARGNIGSKFIPQAITWLNQQRFHDYAEVVVAAPNSADLDWDAALTSFKRTGHWSRHAPRSDISEAPPDLLAKHGLLPDGRPMQ